LLVVVLVELISVVVEVLVVCWKDLHLLFLQPHIRLQLVEVVLDQTLELDQDQMNH
tara:strand:+ start:566 stop:733 length:168 start_codon:yes stop_codon:yes gene_type:complete